MNDKHILIERLALSTQTGFHLPKRQCQQLATAYLNRQTDLKPLLNRHGNLDDVVIDMLLQAHVFSKAQLRQRLKDFAHLN